MNAHPGPMVSGNHFFPAEPLLCTKLMPACLVMSRKCTCALAVQTNVAQTSSKGRNTRLMEVMESFIGRGSPRLHCALQPRPAWLDQVAPKRARGWTGVRCCPRDASGDMGR